MPIPETVIEIADAVQVQHQTVFDAIARRKETANYRAFLVPKRSGGQRVVHAVGSELSKLHKYLNDNVLQSDHVSRHSAAYAFHRTGGIKLCAQQYCGARWLMRFDIEDFFFRINELAVRKAFEKIGYPSSEAFKLSRLCTTTTLPEYEKGRYCRKATDGPIEGAKRLHEKSSRIIGVLPQGASTSPMLSNLACRSLDQRLTSVSRSLGMVYTRYADDIVLSCRHDLDRRSGLPKVQRMVRSAISREGFALNERKSWTSSPGARKVVLGLLVDGSVPRLTRSMRKRIDRLLYASEAHSLVDTAFHEGFSTASNFREHLHGLVAYARDVDPQRASAFLRRLQSLPEVTSPGMI